MGLTNLTWFNCFKSIWLLRTVGYLWLGFVTSTLRLISSSYSFVYVDWSWPPPNLVILETSKVDSDSVWNICTGDMLFIVKLSFWIISIPLRFVQINSFYSVMSFSNKFSMISTESLFSILVWSTSFFVVSFYIYWSFSKSYCLYSIIIPLYFVMTSS